MKRVMLIGSPGVGKSTFAKKLAIKTGLPLIHLDFYYHDSTKNYYIDKPAWQDRTRELAKADRWIIDGNYSGTMAERMEIADTIIYFDLPRRVALHGVLKRRAQAKRVKRTDMPSDWQETMALDFLKYVWKFRKKYAAGTRELLDRNSDKQIVIFKSRKQADEFLASL